MTIAEANDIFERWNHPASYPGNVPTYDQYNAARQILFAVQTVVSPYGQVVVPIQSGGVAVDPNSVYGGGTAIPGSARTIDFTSNSSGNAMNNLSVPFDVATLTAQPQSKTTAPTVTLRNLSRSSANFYVGDSWQVTIRGEAGKDVSVTTSHDGYTSSASYGQTDASGSFILTGSMAASHVGNWLETWKVGGVQASPTLSFFVSAVLAAGSGSSSGSSGSSNQQPPQTASVQLANLSRPGKLDFIVGDRWQLTIHGPALQPVADTASFNGQSSTTIHGQTDASGVWSVTGTMAAEHVGNWTETWKVGSVQATPTLSFKVTAAPSSSTNNGTDGTDQTGSGGGTDGGNTDDRQVIGETGTGFSWPEPIQQIIDRVTQDFASGWPAWPWPWYVYLALAGGAGFLYLNTGRRRR